jgi:hypothetical protein
VRLEFTDQPASPQLSRQDVLRSKASGRDTRTLVHNTAGETVATGQVREEEFRDGR